MQLGFFSQLFLTQANPLPMKADVFTQCPAMLWNRRHAGLPKQEGSARATVYMLYLFLRAWNEGLQLGVVNGNGSGSA
jgi:hypothetical protein